MKNDDELNGLLKDLDDRLSLVYGPNPKAESLGNVLAEMAYRIFGKDKMQYLNIIDIKSGVPHNFQKASWWEMAKKEWENENYLQLASINIKKVDSICEIMLDGIQKGRKFEDIAKRLTKIIEMTFDKANIIVFDQVNKLNTFIAKAQDESMGIKSYNWQTMRDDLVKGNPQGMFPDAKPSHFDMDFKICRWDNNSVFSDDGGKTWKQRTENMPHNAPGIEFLCRCKASPYFVSFLNENND